MSGKPRQRFRILSRNLSTAPNYRPDRWLMNDINQYAKFVWLLFPAVSDAELGAKPPGSTIMVERSLRRLCGDPTCAFLCFYSRCGLARFGKRSAHNTACARWALRSIREHIRHPIGVVAEELPARWVLDSGERPDVLVLDAPTVSRDELLSRWFGRLEWAGYIRDSGWRAESMWPRMRMHFGHDELPAGIPTPNRMGEWRPNLVTEPEIQAVRNRRPIRESLNQ